MQQTAMQVAEHERWGYLTIVGMVLVVLAVPVACFSGLWHALAPASGVIGLLGIALFFVGTWEWWEWDLDFHLPRRSHVGDHEGDDLDAQC